MDYYYHDDETGMEHWHDGVDHSEHCHDAVGLITRTWQTLDDFLTDYPNADFIGDERSADGYTIQKIAEMVGTATKCAECGRIFDLMDEDDASEYYYGHDCE